MPFTGMPALTLCVTKSTGASEPPRCCKRGWVATIKLRPKKLLFWSLDRLSRGGVRETLNHLQRLTSYGVDWKSYTEEYLDSCGLFREAVIGILAVIAKQQRVRRSKRAKAAIARLRCARGK